MKRCLVTGGAGLIGSHLADFLIQQGCEVTVVDDLSTGSIENIPSAARSIVSPIESVGTDAFKGVDVVFHLAALSGEAVSFFAPTDCFLRNINAGHAAVLGALVNRVPRIIFTSSMAVYGSRTEAPFTEDVRLNPTDPYGVSKVAVEQLLGCYGDSGSIQWAALRLHNVYGPRMNLQDPFRGLVGITLARLLRGMPPVIYGDGMQRRAFTFVGDVVPVLARIGLEDTPANGRPINFGSTQVVSVRDVVSALQEVVGTHLEPLYRPSLMGEARDAFTSSDLAAELLGARAQTSLVEGLMSTVEWARKGAPSHFRYDTFHIETDLGVELPRPWLRTNPHS